ncbi:mannose-1-phosphate guanylyltransferase/mannose-6-phosphate isomerase [Legionella antarctica]|uniref:mannose-1-phosphate guanylyltransferase n=1 Tax=Legionella antarctica TaxID=2708020 RepID=A0A6F8T7P3_9GAMM|nr:mannose-1-phosphate guanylyltransferase/mannose-6-phosphate isomerase [Legionella antarctica]BCA96052.1 mannose-1-phosphate guanylyltransferase/mannose-6-phosphate isomerase [Legionella antarctica]
MIQIIPTILSGGEGTRLWPVSRLSHPKPFIKLQDGYSLLQKNFQKAYDLKSTKEIITVTNQDFFFKTLDNYSELNKTNKELSFILEPYPCNTCSAILTAAFFIAKKYNMNALLLVLPADHLVENQSSFEEAVKIATDLATQDRLVTFGIKPDKPQTAYGYIEVSGSEVLGFIEKPSYDKAVEYLKSDNYLWNSGMFCFKTGIILEEAQKHCPELYQATKNCFESSRIISSEDYNKVTLDIETYKLIDNASIDYAILEKSNNIATVPCDIGWKDLGSWDNVADLIPADNSGNQIDAEVILNNVSNSYIKSDHRIIAALGINNLMIIDTSDALLVADKNEAQNIKIIYEQLKKVNHKTYKDQSIEHRPWGSYSILDEGKGFKIKHIQVNPKASLSLQMHHHRSEHWVVVQGKAKANLDGIDVYINPNESLYVPIGKKHKLENPYDELLILIEVQCGSYLAEDDIVRFDDLYGRC